MAADGRGTVLVTGGARRIGAQICRTVHGAGFDIALHYRHSEQDAEKLAAELNGQRPDSCQCYCADLCSATALDSLCTALLADTQKLCGLVNNASVFAAAEDLAQFDTLMNSNLRAPWYLCRCLHKALQASGGAIVNIVDAHTRTPSRGFEVYDASKHALADLTRQLAVEFAPQVRVNAVAPGAILWPESGEALDREAFLQHIPLRRLGDPSDVAAAVLFLLDQSPYITGQVLAVDGGRSLAP